MANAKSFRGKRIQHHFLSDEINQIQDDDPESVDVVITGSPTGGQDSNVENEDNKILNTTRLLEEITGETEVFNIRNDEMTSDGDNSNLKPPPSKKQKQNAKKSKINVKLQKQHI